MWIAPLQSTWCKRRSAWAVMEFDKIWLFVMSIHADLLLKIAERSSHCHLIVSDAFQVTCCPLLFFPGDRCLQKNLCQSQGVTFLDWTNLSHLCPADNVHQIVTFDNHVRKLMQAIRVIRHRLDEECTWIDKLMPSEYLILLSYPIMLEIPVPSFDMCWPLNLFFLSSFMVDLKSLIWFEQKTSTYKKQTIKSEKSLWSGNYLFKVKAKCSIKSNRFDSWLILKNNTWLLLKGLHQFVKPITPPLDSAFCTLEVKAAAAAEPAPNVFCTCQKLEPLTVIQHLFWTLD